MTTNVLLYVVGYETRASFIADTKKFDKRIAIIANSNRSISFDENLQKCEDRKDIKIEETAFNEDLLDALVKEFSKLGHTSINLSIDVSSMSRELMAKTLLGLESLVGDFEFGIEILYAYGKYQPPKKNKSSFLDLSPVVDMEGWSLYPERPLSLIIGLGYEEDLTAASIEYLDPSGAWVFIADGIDKRWKKDLKRSNKAVYRLLGEDNFVSYHPHNPETLYIELRTMVETLVSRSRVVIMTGGPKIFSAIAMIIKMELGDEVAIWRASSHDFTEIRDTVAEGTVISFQYKLG